MKLLVTAGNTQAPIDRVRCLTNVFTGRTGTAIAFEARRRGHAVTLLTSHPEVARDHQAAPEARAVAWQVVAYRTFAELEALLEQALRQSPPDALIHSAAVSDYLVTGVFAPDDATRFDPATAHWLGHPPALLDRSAGKVKSDAPELWLRLTRAPKLIDRVRADWQFRGMVVKFKLEVGLADSELLVIAEQSRVHSRADLMVANTLEGAAAYAFVGFGDRYVRIARSELASHLLDRVEAWKETKHG
jgi:phosphopantothenate-cysteine ligase/phosphopantothenoylcysteine decarboxylase/phosphopantothenate--cysteine ligase